MSLSAHVSLEIEGVSDPLRVTRLRGEERLHAPFRFELRVLARPHGEGALSLDADQLLGAAARVQLADEPPRLLAGVVEQVEAEEEGYRIIVVPEIAVLSDVIDYRVFLDQDAVDIAKTLLSERGLEVEERLSARPEKRPQTVLAWEPVLDFVSRLLAEEGIVWWTEASDSARPGTDSTSRVVFAGGPSASAPIEGEETLPFGAGQAGGLDGEASVFGTEVRRVATVDRVTLSDFDFERPGVDPTASAGQGPLEYFEALAGARTSDVAARRAALRLDELAGHRVTLRGRTNSRRLAPGRTFELRGAAHPAENGKWLVVSLEHEGSDFGATSHSSSRTGADGNRRTGSGNPGAGGSGGAFYEATFVAIPADQAYRPARTRAPMPGGLQMGTVTGPAGTEIHTEPHGRIKTQLRWDRRGKEDDTASAWIRPVHPPMSGGFFLPRVGWEVLFGFGRAAADEPYQLGRLDNGVHVPAESLPGQKVRSAFGSRTTPGGGSQNLLRMDDAAGVEGFSLVASKNMNERTENDKLTSVTADETVVVGANHTEIVGIQQTVVVAGAQSLTVGGNRDMTTTGQFAIQAASESVSVGGVRKFQVGGDMSTSCASLTRTVGGAKAEVAIEEQNRHVTGPHTLVVGAGWAEVGGLSSSVSVLGASTLTAGGPIAIQTANYSLKASSITETYGAKTESAGGARVHEAKASLSLKVGGALSLKGSLVVFDAPDIKISAGGATIKLGGSTITIDGKLDTSGGSLVAGDETHS